MEEVSAEVDVMVEDIHIIPETKPVVEQKPVMEQTPVVTPISAFRSDNDVTTAAERIRRIHDLLRNNANGADIVQSMSTSDISEETLYEGRASAQRESSSARLRSDGRMVQNPYFRDQAD